MTVRLAVAKRVWMILMAALVTISGCVTAPPGQQTSSASYAGDRASYSLEEIVVTIQIKDTGFYNLHVGLSAIVNPRKTTWSEPYDVLQILRSQQARIQSRIVEQLLGKGMMTSKAFPQLRDELTAIARTVFDPAFSKWTKAEDYNVELVVSSFYLTDLSVGKPVASARTIWF